METAYKQPSPEVPLQGPLPPFAGSLEALKDAGRQLMEGRRIVPLSLLQYNSEKTVLCAVILPPRPRSEVDSVGSPSAAVAATPVDVLRLAAVKMVRKPPGKSRLMTALRDEAEKLASLHASPRVAHALAYVEGTDTKGAWAALLTEYAEGGDLEKGTFNAQLSASTVHRLACQLRSDRQLLKHRDLIPRNVVLFVDREAQLQLKVVDWESTSMTPSTESSTSAHPHTNASFRTPDVSEFASAMKSLPLRDTSPQSQSSDTRRAKPPTIVTPFSEESGTASLANGSSDSGGSEGKGAGTPLAAMAPGPIQLNSSAVNDPFPAVESNRETSELHNTLSGSLPQQLEADTFRPVRVIVDAKKPVLDWLQQQPTPVEVTDTPSFVPQLSWDACSMKVSLLALLHHSESIAECDKVLESVLRGAPMTASVSPVDGAAALPSEAVAIRDFSATAATLFQAPSYGVPPRTRALLKWFNKRDQAFPSVRDGVIVAADPSDQTLLGPFPTSDLWFALPDPEGDTEEFPANAAALLNQLENNPRDPRSVDT